MSPEMQNRLFAAYPEILLERCDERSTLHTYGISCRDGWYALLERLLHELQQLVISEHIAQPVAVDVKEKLGKLKVHWRHPRRLDPRVLALTALAEVCSGCVCDLCGAPGNRLMDCGWWRTRCEVHRNDSGWPRSGQVPEAPTPPSDQGDDGNSAQRELREAVERMHVRDRERVIAGEIAAEDLHFIPAETAKKSIVRWTAAAVRWFRR